MKYWITTYGCQMNRSDSERMASVLEKNGYSPAPKIGEADLIMVNMCSIRQSAVDRVYGKLNQISKIKNQNDKLKYKIILTGCILATDRKKLKNKVDFVLDIKNLPNWPKILKKENAELLLSQEKNSGYEYLKIVPKYTNKFSVSIPISTGCNNACTYCVVPFTRGKLACRPYREIVNEAQRAIKGRAKEIWLLGENVNDYYVSRPNEERMITSVSRPNEERMITNVSRPNEKRIDFADLLKMVNEISGNFWIRFTSPHPSNFSPKLIKTIAKSKKVTPYLNLPVQSGDDEILKRMGRGYTVKKYKNLVKSIREAFKAIREEFEKNIAISTDIIAGFPGETKRQFENTAKLMREVKFDMAYIAEYSPRPGTVAFKMKDNVSHQEKERRRKILNEILEQTAFEKNKQFIGKEILVLVEESKNGFLMGKSKHYKTVKFQGKSDLIGQFVKVEITKVLPWGLEGEI